MTDIHRPTASAIIEGFEKNLHPLKIYINDVKQFLIPHLSHLKKRGRRLYFLLRYFGFMGVWLYVRLKGKKMVNHIHFLCDESQNRSY